MNKSLWKVVLSLLVVLAFLMVAVLLVGNVLGIARFQTYENVPMRFAFVIIGLLIAFAIYFFTRENKGWEVGTRQVVYMSIGAALYAVLSWIFNSSVFIVPSVSQVAFRPAIAIPMFFGYAFGPVVGLFTGAVGNMFGDALTGFGLSPQWSIGNGLVGLIAGLPYLFKDKKKSLDAVLIASGALTLLGVVLYFLNRSLPNMMFYDPANNIFGDQQLALYIGISLLIGFVLVLAVRFFFGKNIDIAAAVTWSALGNIIGIGFAAIADIWVNGYSFAVAMVGEFLPAAGPNMVFAAILVPLLVVAYAAVQRQTGR